MFNPLPALCLVPAVYFGLLYFGVLTHEKMRRWRRWSWIAILILAAVVTPTGDIFTMLLLALPMVVGHEVIVWSAALRERRMQAAPARARRR